MGELRNVERFMRENGFTPHRRATHGHFWRDQHSMILVPEQHKTSDPRAWQNLLSEIRRAIRHRREKEGLPPKEPTMPGEAPLTTRPLAKLAEVIVHKQNGETKVIQPEVRKYPAPQVRAMQASRQPRLDNETKEIVRLKVREIAERGAETIKDVADQLYAEKITHPTGHPISRMTVARVLEDLGIDLGTRRTKPLPPPPEVQPVQVKEPEPAPTPSTPKAQPESVPLFVLEILRRPDWSAEKKVRVLLAVAEP